MQTYDYHNPVLKDEAIAGMRIRPGGLYVDATFGGGGHSRQILGLLDKKGKLIAFDQDADALKNAPDDDRLLLLRQNFKFLKNNLLYHGYDQVDGILADLGVSSHQFDGQGRGFSFRFPATLDMRMNQNAPKTAADVLNQYPEDKLIEIFKMYGEVQNAKKLVAALVEARKAQVFGPTDRFIQILKAHTPQKHENQYMAKVFQALRIEVNGELLALENLLLQGYEMLKPGGRLVVISYHSLEDRMVKNFIKTGNFEGKVETDFYGNRPVFFKAINNRVIVPAEEEIAKNNRARSAKLRIAEKI
jgi:16S rRNA (cytosine1402-N4)-methyltransferase